MLLKLWTLVYTLFCTWLFSIKYILEIIACISLSLFFFFVVFRAASVTYGNPQAMDRIGAIVASLRHSHDNSGSEPHLCATPQLTSTPDP